MRLQRLTQLERDKVVEEHTEVLQLIERLRAILASDALVRQIIRDEALALKTEYGDERRTEIVEESIELTLEDLIADEEMVVTVTRSGYIKRTAIEAYRSQRRGGKGVTGMETKEEDVVESVYIASTHAYLLFFTNDGKVHWLKVHEIPEAKRDARGKALVNLLHLAEGERVAATLSVRDFTTGGYVFFATRQGRVKKTELVAYSRPQRGGIRAITLDEGDEVMAVRVTDGQREVLLGDPAGDGDPVQRGGSAPDGPGGGRRQGHRGRAGGRGDRGGRRPGGRDRPHGDRSGLRQADAARRVPAPGARRQGHPRHQDRGAERARWSGSSRCARATTSSS